MDAASTARTRVSGCETCGAREARIAAQAHRGLDYARGPTGQSVPAYQITDNPDVLLNLSNVTAPRQQPPGATSTITATFANQADVILPSDPDRCGGAFGLAAGLEVTAILFADGARQDERTVCVRQSRNVDLSFVMPDAGSTSLRIEAELTRSGDRVGSWTGTVTVSEAAEKREGTEDENGDGGGGPILPCFLDPNRACAGPESLAWGGIGLLFVLVLLSS